MELEQPSPGGPPGAGMRRVIVQEDDFDAAALQDELRAQCRGAGAVVTFTGYVRDFAPGEPTAALHLEHYPGMCERELAEIGDTAMRRWQCEGYVVAHRVGALARDARIVFVATASAHRGDAFRACEYIIDALKTRAPFWKSEQLADGRRFWVQQREADAERTREWDSSGATTKEQQ